MATSGPDLLVAAFLALNDEEQQEAFERVHRICVGKQAGTDSEAGRYIRSLRRVAEELGRVPTVDDYKEMRATLAEAGEAIETFARRYRFFGSWPRATEALELSELTTTKRIEARFRERRIGKVWRYTEDLLRETLMRAADHWGRPPSTQEFEWWRERELELAGAAGDKAAFLPSTNPYRKRFGSWEGALLHFGFTPEQVALRLEGKIQPHNRNADPYLPDGLPVAELGDPNGQTLPLTEEQLARMLEEWNKLARRSRYVLTVRLGLGGAEPLTLREAAEPLALHLDRIRQLQLAAIGALSRAAAGGRREKPTPTQLREPVQDTLRFLARRSD
jgi:hypothetical protein